MRKSIVGILLIIFILLIIPNQTDASIAGVNPDDFKNIAVEEDLAGSLGDIIGIVQIVGVAVSVIACIVMGIRYVLSTTEDRADIKKKLIPFVIGAIIFFGATGILRLIASLGSWFGNS